MCWQVKRRICASSLDCTVRDGVGMRLGNGWGRKGWGAVLIFDCSCTRGPWSDFDRTKCRSEVFYRCEEDKASGSKLVVSVYKLGWLQHGGGKLRGTCCATGTTTKKSCNRRPRSSPGLAAWNHLLLVSREEGNKRQDRRLLHSSWCELWSLQSFNGDRGYQESTARQIQP